MKTCVGCVLTVVLLAAGCAQAGVRGPAEVRAPAGQTSDPGGTTTARRDKDPVRGGVDRDSSRVPCARRTTDLGVHRGFSRGDAILVRLCAVQGLRSTSPESQPGDRYYVDGAAGDAIVNARVSAAVSGLIRVARRHGLTLVAISSFRTMRHQQDLCSADEGCRRHDYTFVAPGGFSNHQLGIAIDFAGTTVRGRRSCVRGRAQDPGSRTWRFLAAHGSRFGLRQYAAESWHWDASTAADRC